MSEDVERIQAQLREEAGGRSTGELVAQVQAGADEMHGAARALPEELWDVPSPGAGLSPQGCLEAAVRAQMAIAREVLWVALTGERPAAAEEPAVSKEREAALVQHQEALDSLYAHVAEADPAGFLAVRWNHELLGSLNWREWLVFLRVHAQDCAEQLRKMLPA